MRPLAVKVPHRECIIAPACCLHWPIGEQSLIREWVDAIRSRPNAYTILMGDSLDQARSHYRKHLKSYTDDENSQEAYDGYVREEVRKLAAILEPIKSRIWGAIRGNHYHEYMDGTNTEQDLCRLLGIPYMGAVGLLRVTMPVNGNTHRSIKVLAHHNGGSQGGRTTGGDVAGLTRIEAGWDVDVYLAGHTHRRWGTKEAVLTVTDRKAPRVVERTKVFARCGTFLKGFREDNPSATQRHAPSYAEDKLLRPTDLGWVEIAVTWRSSHGTEQRAYPDYRLAY